MNKLFFNVLIVLFILSGCQNSKQPVDSIIIAPKIYIANANFDFAEAMAIKDGKVVAQDIDIKIWQSILAHYREMAKAPP